MAIFDNEFIAYARPPKHRLAINLLQERAVAGSVVPSLAISLAGANPANVPAIVAAVPHEALHVLLVPDIDRLPHDPKRKTPAYSFTRKVPAIATSAGEALPWLREVTTAQVEAGGTAVVTPSLFLEPNYGDTEVRRMLEWAEEIRELRAVSGRPVLTGLSLHRNWVGDPAKLELLLNTITDADHDAFYLAVRWAPASSGQGYSQIADDLVLQGLREVVTVLPDNDQEAVVARAGLAGYPLTALGASAFVAGTALSHTYRDPTNIRRGKGSSPPPRISHYLDRRLLGYVPAAQLSVLERVSGPWDCDCRSCAALVSRGLYDDGLGFMHLLGVYTELAEALGAASDQRAEARRRVRDALKLLGDNPDLGLPAYSTSHLTRWRDLLA